jgi:signal transduction histidine kinase
MPATPAILGPWFRRHPCLAAVAATALFAAIVALQYATDEGSDAVSLLLVLPIALVAQAFGLRAGTAAAVAGAAVQAAWIVSDGTDVSVLGWAGRTIPMLLLGILIGHASDVQRDAERLLTTLAVAEERQREAAEINDTIVQSLAVAKWKLESGDVAGGLAVLDETIDAGVGLVDTLLGGLRLSNGERRRSRPRALHRSDV